MSTAIAFDFDKARFNMIEQQIRPWDVLDAKVLALLGEVKREDFVPEAYQPVALADLEVPLGQGEGQCMLAPKVEARLLQDLALQAGDSVLEIGTGSGYLTALMARQCARVGADPFAKHRSKHPPAKPQRQPPHRDAAPEIPPHHRQAQIHRLPVAARAALRRHRIKPHDRTSFPPAGNTRCAAPSR